MTYIPENSLSSLAKKIWQDTLASFSSMTKIERGLNGFWLLGPFLMLIERSPGDLWISVIAVAFLVRSIIQRKRDWLKIFWVKAAFAFWFVTIISALLSDQLFYSLGEALVWFRFPLFAMAVVFWFGKDRRMLYAMLAITLMAVIVMCLILSAELYFEGQKNGRLMWPYGDHVPGNYLSKVGMPVFAVLVAFAVSERGKLAAISGAVAAFTIVISLLTGERINFLIRACGGMLAGLLWRPKWHRYILLLIVEVVAVSMFFVASPDTSNRYIDNFVEQLPIYESSNYYKTMKPALIAYERSPVWGIGTATYRNACEDLIVDQPHLQCHPHPHNFYLQLLGETGILGLVFGVVFICSIIITCLLASLKNRDNIVLATAWVVPFGFFWPIASSADFFGQWNNIFMWSAISLSLASCNLVQAESKTASDVVIE